jgi:hypothetical protein
LENKMRKAKMRAQMRRLASEKMKKAQKAEKKAARIARRSA